MIKNILNKFLIIALCIILPAAGIIGCGKQDVSYEESTSMMPAEAEKSEIEAASSDTEETAGSREEEAALSGEEIETDSSGEQEEIEHSSEEETATVQDSAPETPAEPEKGVEQDLSDAPEIDGLTCTGKMEPDYAVTFEIYDYEGGYSLIDVFGDSRYLLIPEDGEIPEGLPEDIICLKKPFERIYMVATAVYSLFDSMGALDRIRFTGTDKGGIYLEEVDRKLESGEYTYAGRYSAPDYETLIKEGCDLSIQSTRIYHTPEIKEVLESLMIPVFVDRSSYETHPLGRTEWIRVYGVLLDMREEADAYFSAQKAVIDALEGTEPTGKRVLFFYMNTDGTAVIRRPEDYMVKMIEIAGGEYAFKDYKANSTLSAISISMEEFYAIGKDADVIIYNASVNSPLTSIEELIGMEGLFEDFKAVREGEVWTTDKSVFQASNITSQFTMDIYEILHDKDESKLQFLKRVH